MKRLSTLFILISPGLLGAAAAEAHQCWLAPSTYSAAAGDTVVITSFVGTGFRGEQKPYAATRTLRLSLEAKKSIDLRPGAMNGDLTYARFIVPDDRGAVVAYHSNYVPIELPAAEFDHYLTLEGLDVPLRARAELGSKAGPGRERYARCAKTWIAGRDAKRLLEPLGLPLELVPLEDPTTSPTLRVRLLHLGRPLKGTLVKVWNQPLLRAATPQDAAARDSVGVVAQARTNEDGVVTLPINRPGEWMVNAVHMMPSRDHSVADWESLWASLTFARASGERKR